ncbi:MAG: hypothetical protein ACAI44_33920, partial [Candidatus Sericytochromatia bacterium]
GPELHPTPLSAAPAAVAFEIQDFDEPDYDALLDQAQIEIRSLIQQLGTSGLAGRKPTADPAALQALSGRFEGLRSRQQSLSEQLAIINQELEVSSLERQMSVIAKVLHESERFLKTSAEFVAMRRELETQAAEVRALAERGRTVQAAAELGELEKRLQELLDSCDRNADRIDAFESSGFEIAALTPAYEALSGEIEDFQELLEDAAEALNSEK